MNENSCDPEPADPPLSALIDENKKEEWNRAWNNAYLKLYGIAVPIIKKRINGVSDDIIGDIFMTAIADLRHGLTILRASIAAEIGKSWKKVNNFRDVKILFACVLKRKTLDWIRKQKSEFPYEDQRQEDQIDQEHAKDPMLEIEWDNAYKKATSKMRPIYRDVLLGMQVQGYDTYELMKMHKLPKGTIAVFALRGKEELREVILSDPELTEILWPKMAKLKKGK